MVPRALPFDSRNPLFLLGVLVVALAYSAVGHGGASGYLALIAFTKMPPKDGATLALAINVVVAAIAFALYRRAKYFEWGLAWPLLAGSIPAAFLGGLAHLTDSVHRWVLAAVLLYAALTLMIKLPVEPDDLKKPSVGWLILTGVAIGALSGMVGVGGGIFLSPILILSGWSTAKTTASTSALFILCNSLSGLAARSISVGAVVTANWPILVIAVVGALIGSWIGAMKLSDVWLRRSLGAVMLVAVTKMIFG